MERENFKDQEKNIKIIGWQVIYKGTTRVSFSHKIIISSVGILATEGREFVGRSFARGTRITGKHAETTAGPGRATRR